MILNKTYENFHKKKLLLHGAAPDVSEAKLGVSATGDSLNMTLRCGATEQKYFLGAEPILN